MLIIKLNNKKVVSAMHSRTCKKVLSRRTFQLCLPLTLTMIERNKPKNQRDDITKKLKQKEEKKVIC